MIRLENKKGVLVNQIPDDNHSKSEVSKLMIFHWVMSNPEDRLAALAGPQN